MAVIVGRDTPFLLWYTLKYSVSEMLRLCRKADFQIIRFWYGYR